MANISIVAIVYVSIQVVVALFVSVFGAIHVRRSMHATSAKEASSKSIQPSLSVEVEQKDTDNTPPPRKLKGFRSFTPLTQSNMRSVNSTKAHHRHPNS
eukprot:257658_1